MMNCSSEFLQLDEVALQSQLGRILVLPHLFELNAVLLVDFAYLARADESVRELAVEELGPHLESVANLLVKGLLRDQEVNLLLL